MTGAGVGRVRAVVRADALTESARGLLPAAFIYLFIYSFIYKYYFFSIGTRRIYVAKTCCGDNSYVCVGISWRGSYKNDDDHEQ